MYYSYLSSSQIGTKIEDEYWIEYRKHHSIADKFYNNSGGTSSSAPPILIVN